MSIKVFRAYTLATLSVGLALLLTLHIPILGRDFRFLLFALAVAFSATGGIWPGVFATLLSAAAAWYFLIPPLQSLAVSGPHDLFRLLLFCGVGVVITWITYHLRQSDATLRAAAAVVESSVESIIQQGLDDTILSWNKAAEHTYGYTAQEAIGRPISLIVPPDHMEELQQLVERVHLRGSVQGHETVRLRKDGTRVDVELTLYLVRDRKGEVVGISGIAAEITERKQAEEAMRQSHAKLELQTHQLRLLARMNEMLQASSIPADAHTVTARCAEKLFPASTGALYVHSASKDHLESVLKWGEPLPEGHDFLAAEECWGLRTGRMHVVEDPRTDLLCRHLPEPPPPYYLCAPMIAHGETLGLLHVRMSPASRASAETSVPGSLELTWPAGTMAERLALALADMNLREALRVQSICDPLTGWYNRRHMQEALERDIRRATRAQRPLSLIMFDIDNFKEFNDSFGHEAGDVALQNVCLMLKTLVRSEDVACRYGGDEFVLILPDTSVELGAQRAEEMRLAVGQAEWQYQGHLLNPMTLSFGIATFPTDATTSHELLRAADTALLRAKGEGRDRVRLYGVGSEPTTLK